tara:strand:+ start:95 stop:622 length:528 start_codon:yes stop_codon:yes gene_type:complete
MEKKLSNEWLVQNEITNKIIELSGYNIFKLSRKREIVEFRALAYYIFKNKFKMQWTDIVRFFEAKGLKRNHATIIWSVNSYETYRRSNKKLNEIENMISFKTIMDIKEIDRVTYLENKCKHLEKQLQELTNGSNLHTLIKKIPKEREGEAISRLELIIKGWEWQHNDRSTAYVGE